MSRTYGYNLEVGEHYYSPMTTYLEAERGSRGETPGALTYNERLAKKWIYGRRYESTDLRDRVRIKNILLHFALTKSRNLCSLQYSRAASVARGEGQAAAVAQSASYLVRQFFLEVRGIILGSRG